MEEVSGAIGESKLGHSPVGIPPYAELPQLGDHEASRASWSHFGPGDLLGGLNRLSESAVRDACRNVQAGRVFSLNWNIELPSPPLFSRRPVRREVTEQYGYVDDKLDNFYLQGSTQWDSLTHVRHPTHGFYNDAPQDADGIVPPNYGGMHVWARRGIAGRFVLVDVAGWREAQGRPIDPARGEQIQLSDILGTLDAQASTVEPGDILLFRLGWLGWYEGLDQAAREAFAVGLQPNTPGLAATDEIVEWLWECGAAAVAADNPGVEATPADLGEYGSLHLVMLPLLGIPFGEMFVLDALAADCAEDGVYHGLFTAAPLNVVGAVGSPANALCIK